MNRLEKLYALASESLGEEFAPYLDDGDLNEVPEAFAELIEFYRRFKAMDDKGQPGPIQISTISSACQIVPTRVFDLTILKQQLKKMYLVPYNFHIVFTDDATAEFGNSLTIRVSSGVGKLVNMIIFQN